MAGLRAAHLRRNGEQNGSREIRKNRSGLATGEGYVSRVPPFSRAADYSPGLVFHAKRLHNRTSFAQEGGLTFLI